MEARAHPFNHSVPLRLQAQTLGMLLWWVAVLLPGVLPAQESGDEKMEEGFAQHLDHFHAEIEDLCAQVDGITAAYRDGEDVFAMIEEWIDSWEHVAVHEVIETEAVHLYPAIWQGIFAMKQTAESPGAEGAVMARNGDRTKAALWQGLGGLRVLAEITGAAVPDARNRGEFSRHGSSPEQVDNHIELTGDDSMRFNRTEFVVHAGEPVTLRFKNMGQLPKQVMGHNVVILAPGTPLEPFALAAAEAPENDFIPTDPSHRANILAHTALLGPGEAEELTFTLEERGSHPFICSFTAHFRLMRGTILAVPNPARAPVAAILEWLKEAVAIYEGGDATRAEELVHETYMTLFEGLEGELIERDPELVSQLELDFNAGLPSLFQEGAPVDAVHTQLDAMRDRLEIAKRHLADAEAERPSIF